MAGKFSRPAHFSHFPLSNLMETSLPLLASLSLSSSLDSLSFHSRPLSALFLSDFPFVFVSVIAPWSPSSFFFEMGKVNRLRPLFHIFPKDRTDHRRLSSLRLCWGGTTTFFLSYSHALFYLLLCQSRVLVFLLLMLGFIFIFMLLSGEPFEGAKKNPRLLCFSLSSSFPILSFFSILH